MTGNWQWRRGWLGWVWLLGSWCGPAAGGPAGPSPAAPAAAPAAPGDPIRIDSDRQEGAGDRITARGHVRITYHDVVLQADEVEVDRRTKDAVATGNVLLQEQDRRITGERLEFNLETKLGRLWSAWGFAEPDVWFEAAEVEKTGEDRYHLKGARVTSCNQPRPQWRLAASSATYRSNHYIRLWNARLEVFGVPLVYLPVFQYPAREDRATGFLFPAIGTSKRDGFFLANSFFLALGRSYDATVTHEYYKLRGSVFRGELLYVPSRDTAGSFRSENHFDTLEDRVRSQYHLLHNQRLGRTWQLGADVNYASDESIDQDYSNNITRISRRTRSSSAFLSRNWSRYSLGVAGSEQVLLGDLERTNRRLPTADFSIRETALAGPVRGSLRTGAVRFSQRSGADDFLAWDRFDANPTVSVPLSPRPWLKVSPAAHYRLTYYSRSYAPDSGRQALTDDSFLRRFGAFGAEVVGPVFSRVFHTPGNSYSEKFKHVIEPVVAYSYTQLIDVHDQALQIDAVDRLPATNQVAFGLRNRLLAKRSVVAGGLPIPYELLTVGLSLAYSLDPDLGTYLDGRNPQGVVPSLARERRGPLVGEVLFVPTGGFRTNYRFYLDTRERVFTSQSVDGSWSGETFHTAVSFSRGRDLSRVTSEQVRGLSAFNLFGRRLQMDGTVAYDFVRESLQDLGGSLVYKTQCCGFGAGYKRVRLGARNDNVLRFSISLRNIGTVFDYSFGESQL